MDAAPLKLEYTMLDERRHQRPPAAFHFQELCKMTHSTHEKGFVAPRGYRERTWEAITNGYRTSLEVRTKTKLNVEIKEVEKS